MCVSSSIPIKVFAYVGAHFVTIAHCVIRKTFLQLNIKFFNVNIIFTKLMIIFARRFFSFSVASTAWSPLSLELFRVKWTNFHHEAVPTGEWEGDFIGPWGTLNFHLPLGRLSQWGVEFFCGGGGDRVFSTRGMGGPPPSPLPLHAPIPLSKHFFTKW